MVGDLAEMLIDVLYFPVELGRPVKRQEAKGDGKNEHHDDRYDLHLVHAHQTPTLPSPAPHRQVG